MSQPPQPGPLPVIFAPSGQSGSAPQQWVIIPAPAPGSQEAPAKEPRLTAWLLLLATILVHTLVNLFWLYTDQHLVRLDEAHHMKQALAYHDAFFAPGENGAAEGLFTALSIESPYPPLVHMVGALCIRFLGGSPDSAALSGSIALALLLISVYMLSRFALSPMHSFLVVCITSFIPMVYGYSRLMMPDTLMLPLLLWTVVSLLKSGSFHKHGWSVIGGCVAGLALLSKQTALLYLTPLLIFFFLSGLKQAFMSRKDTSQERASFSRIFLNLFLFTLTCAALCGWWYGRHADYLFGWWGSSSVEESSFFHSTLAQPLSSILPSATAAPALVADPDLALPFKERIVTSDEGFIDSFIIPFYTHGLRYVFYAVNNALFLPLALLSALGAFALLMKKNRSYPAFLFLFWIVAVWVILTGVLALHSPRFLYPLMPAFAFFVFLAMNALSATRITRAAWAVLFLVLFLQFANLSFLPTAYAFRLELPFFTGEKAVTDRGNHGLVLMSDEIQTGHYVIHSPQLEEAVTTRLVAAMEQCDNRLNPPDQSVAWYQVVSNTPSALALDFYTRSFPRPAWLINEDSPEEKGAIRPLAAINEEVQEASATLQEISGTDFVILQQTGETLSVQAIESDMAFFMQQGFTPVFSEALPGSPVAASGRAVLMARAPMRPLEECTDLFSLYELLDRDGREWLLSDEERRVAEARYAEAIESHTVARPLNKDINFLGVHVARVSEDIFMIRLIIHAKQEPQKALRVWLRGVPVESTTETVLENCNWDFDPQPPSLKWGRNQAFILSRPIVVPEATSFHLEIGLYDAQLEDRPVPVTETEPVDFARADPLYLCGELAL